MLRGTRQAANRDVPHDGILNTMNKAIQISALYVEEGGCYYGIENVDAWPESRDARLYRGPYPVIAHPPCQRWGRFWHGSTRKPHQFRLGEDSGCFAAALTAVRNYGGILEHPAGSLAWRFFGLNRPRVGHGWIKADNFGGWTCQVDQKHYGHEAPKPTWLYAVGTERTELRWEKSDRTPPGWMIERYGERKARKIGVVAMIGGKNKTKLRNATPQIFRDILIDIACSVKHAKPGNTQS